MSVDLRDPNLLVVQRLREAGFTAEQIAVLAVVFDPVCTHCFDAERPCYCWNDE